MNTEERFYVYVHKRKSDNIVFYIGKGTKDRSRSTSRKNKQWKDVANEHGWYDEILVDNITEQLAVSIENSYLAEPPDEWELVNIQPACEVHDISIAVTDLLYYDETSLTCLRWRKGNGQTNHCRRDAGDIAGYLQKDTNRYKVSVLGKELMVHRVVMMLHGHLVEKGLVVNHKDCNSSNNRIDNLELVTAKVNSIKRKDNVTGTPSSSNTSGTTGVVELTTNKHKDYAGNTYAFAYVNDPSGKRINKFYSYKTHGKEEAWELATAFRREKMKEYYGDWYE